MDDLSHMTPTWLVILPPYRTAVLVSVGFDKTWVLVGKTMTTVANISAYNFIQVHVCWSYFLLINLGISHYAVSMSVPNKIKIFFVNFRTYSINNDSYQGLIKFIFKVIARDSFGVIEQITLIF